MKLASFFVGNAQRPDPDFPLAPVPAEARRAILSIGTVLLGFTFFYATMYAGAAVGAAYRFWPDLHVVLACGSAVLGLYVALLAAVGARTGLTTVLLARRAFGDWGSRGVDLLLGGTQLGWFGVTVALMARPFTQWLAEAGLDVSWADRRVMVAMCLLWALAHTATAFFGYRGMEMLSFVAVPMILGLGCLMSVRAFADAEAQLGGITHVVPQHTMVFSTAMTMIVGTFASGGTQAPNWARFARGPAAGFWATLLAFCAGNGLMLWFGAVGGAVYGEPDFAAVLKLQGFLGLGLLLLALNVWTTNDNAAYSVGVAGSSLLRYPRKRPFILVCGAVGFLIAISGGSEMVMGWMTIMGIAIPPVGGVLLADHLVCRHRPALDVRQRFCWPGLAAYAAGLAAAIAGQALALGIPPLNGILVAALVHALLTRGHGRPGVR